MKLNQISLQYKKLNEETMEDSNKKFRFNNDEITKIDKILGNQKKHYAWYENRLALKKDLTADAKTAILNSLKQAGMGEPMLDAELNEIYFVKEDTDEKEKEEESTGAIDMITTAKTASSDALFFLTAAASIDVEKALNKSKEAKENLVAAIAELEKQIKK